MPGKTEIFEETRHVHHSLRRSRRHDLVRRRAGSLARREDLRAGGAGPRGLLGGAGQDAALGQAVREGPGVEGAVREVVRWRQAQRIGQLSRPASRGARREAGADLGRGAGRCAHVHVSPASRRGFKIRERPEIARREAWRSRRHLHAAGAGGGRGHAGLRAHRSRALGRLRRIFIRGIARSHSGCRG